jgi:hypothetical protein
MQKTTQHGNATSGAVSADQRLATMAAAYGLTVDELVRGGQGVGLAVDDLVEVAASGERVRMTEPLTQKEVTHERRADGVKSSRTGDSRQRREVVDPPLARSHSALVPPAPGSADLPSGS